MVVFKGAPAYILGVGMTKFIKPRGQVDYTELGFEAGVKAMLDARISYDDVEQGVACFCYGDSCSGQRVFYQFGMTKIPIYNVNNNCCTGSTGLVMAKNAVASGQADCVLVIGFEKMKPGSLSRAYSDRADPVGLSETVMEETTGKSTVPFSLKCFGNAGREYMEKYTATLEDFAEIARINHSHSVNNPYSQFRDVYTLEQIVESPMVYEPLTKLQCCPTSDGGAAAVVVSQAFLDARPHLKSQAVLIAGQCLASDAPSLYDKSAIGLVGAEMSRYAAEVAMKEAQVTPEDIKVCELHDCFATNEMVTIEALGLAKTGTAYQMVRNGDITYGGKMVINPSGGLISKGHPIGATGLAQCAELVWHLRGWANNRLFPGTKAVLQHNLGLGGAVVVSVLKRADGQAPQRVESVEVARLTGLGYNPAVEAKGFTATQAARVLSKKSPSEWARSDVQERVQSRF